MFKKTLMILSVLGATACEQASETVINIPDVRVGCTTADNTDCSTSNPNPSVVAFVRMTRSGCGSSIEFDPVATGSVIMFCDASGCDGTVDAWTNPETSEPVTEILSGVMDICSQVDLNNTSSLPDSGDLVDEQSRNIGSDALLTIDTWVEQ